MTPKRSADNPLRLIVTGGGTGGHLFPGIAIAQTFLARHPRNRVLFVGTDRPFETDLLASLGYDHRIISAAGIKGRGLINQLGALLKLPRGILQAIAIVLRFRPHLVVGMGGYSAGPLVFVAWLMRIKRVLHEQNIVPGITNRLLAPLADRLYVSFEDTEHAGSVPKTVVSGNPVRQEILAAAQTRAERSSASVLSPQKRTVLVLGGSQGAHSINVAMVAAMARFDARKRIRVIHQTGKADVELVQKGYAEVGLENETAPFFTEMAALYRQADLIVCRAGATTIAEITAMGKPALFIPFPLAADDHQRRNAMTLVAAGAAELIDEGELDGEMLAGKLNDLLAAPQTLADMGDAARTMGRPEAAATIIDDCFRLLGITAAQGVPQTVQ